MIGRAADAGTGWARWRWPIRRFWATTNDGTASPLTFNGYALIASTVATSAFGVVFWVLAARLYPAEQVGLGAVMISSMVTLGSFAQLNFPNMLNRFVPAAGTQARGLILAAYGVATATALLLSTGFLLVVDQLVPRMAFLPADPLLAAGFVAAVSVWTIFALQDSALASLRQAIWVPIENTVYALAKIVLLVLLAGAATGNIALFAAWTAPLIFVAAAINLLIFGRLLRKPRFQAAPETRFDPRTAARYFGWDYIGGLALTAAMGIAPVLVLSQAGAEASANYHLAWTFTYSLYLIGRSMGISLLAESATTPARMPSLVADAVVHTMLPLAAAALVVATAAPLLMSLFGPSYAREGATLLSVLAVSSIPWGLVTIFLAVARVRGWLRAIAGTQIATLVLVLSIGVLLLPKLGVLGIGVAWLAAHTAVLFGIAAIAVLRGGPDRLTDGLLRLASSVARLRNTLLQPATLRQDQPALASAIEGALQDIGHTDQALRSGAALHSLSDSMVFFLKPAPGGGPVPRAVVKCATSSQGITSLERGRVWQERLREDPRLEESRSVIPRILAHRKLSGAVALIEEALPGDDGRLVLARAGQRPGALDAAARAINSVHRRTGKSSVVDEAWIAEWIERPVQYVQRQSRQAWHLDAWQSFVREQRAYWLSRQVYLGITHGDFSPGNILFVEEPGQSGVPGIRLAGLLDWTEARPDGPAGFDVCHLALTTRMLVAGEELGQVVRTAMEQARREDLPLPNDLDGDDAEWLSQSAATRAMVGLVWLHHLLANIRKAEQYSANPLWTATNVNWVLRSFSRNRRH
ncbi:phosphotransferase [Devosia nitrariae]|uniref:Aminoglycoside phosphotransferase domain-containing protein n=1 Tax=Devosia nitrariae TaxID=2071872 RepID=A0ABQ5W0Q7_9HYPH|nr:phosphotransferase [Devosia nitrariae]GLQ53562.1 hypothetical protein GCM10010862_08210 [Devosia nitrariae]